MTIARRPEQLRPEPRAVAIGTFDGVHIGHRRVLDAAVAAEGRTTAVTFDPHPRFVVGEGVELLTTLERRLELLADAGVEDVLVVAFDTSVSQLAPEQFAERYLAAIGAEVIVAGSGFRFGHKRAGDLELLNRLGFEARAVPIVDAVSSSAIREYLRVGDIGRAAAALGRPPEVEGVVVSGEARGAGLGFPTANLELPKELVVPRPGIYAGAAHGRRAAISIGVNPHYGGRELRVEAFLLDFSGDLYGRRLVVELWQRLRDEQAFASEDELVAQIAADVEQTRRAVRPG